MRCWGSINFNVYTENNYAIRWASANGHAKCVKLLLQDKRVDPTVHSQWALRSAAERGHFQIVRLLLQYKKRVVDASAHDSWAFRIACELGYIGMWCGAVVFGYFLCFLRKYDGGKFKGKGNERHIFAYNIYIL